LGLPKPGRPLKYDPKFLRMLENWFLFSTSRVKCYVLLLKGQPSITGRPLKMHQWTPPSVLKGGVHNLGKCEMNKMKI